MSHRRFLHLAFASLLGFVIITASHAVTPRVTVAYTTWDTLYFYAGFNVHDTNVVSTNDQLTSQPQKDDDIEVFFETDGPRKATVRTSNTFEMAVSAAGGAYYSVGQGTKIPLAKAIFDYKFDTNVDGTMNVTTDTDKGYTVEIAIPWTELGLQVPPQIGTTWGFNVISRDRDSMDAPAMQFYSLSPRVLGRSDVQDPSKWTQIVFSNPVVAETSTTDRIVCPRTTGEFPPVIDGVLRSGEYPSAEGFSFGTTPVLGAAPTTDEEPNVADTSTAPLPTGPSTPDVTIGPQNAPPAPAPAPTAPTTTPGQMASNQGTDYNIYLPGGGVVRVGKPRPTDVSPYLPPQTDTGGPRRGHKDPIYIEPDLPPAESSIPIPGAPDVDTSVPAPLNALNAVSSRVMATYVLDQQSSPSIDSYFDQPIDSLGWWTGGMRGQYVTDQMRNARLSGIEVMLPIFDGSATKLAYLRSLVQALRLMQQVDDDYPLLGLRLTGTGSDYKTIAAFFANVPPQFRAEIDLGDANANKRAYIVVSDHDVDANALNTKFASDFGGRAALAIATVTSTSAIPISIVSPGGKTASGILGRNQAATYQATWDAATKAASPWIMVDSWNDFASGTEVTLSRQYSDQYANLTRVFAATNEGQKPWAAAFLRNDTPAIVSPDTLYEVEVRIENTGSLAWRSTEAYSLDYRWYDKDGKLVDDSNPRIPFLRDILPGESYTAHVALRALNSYGTAIDPGDYTLAFDIVQGQSRWFSYTGNVPLKVAVHVLAKGDAPEDRATFLDSTTPLFVKSGSVYATTVRVRNDGSQTWKAGTTKLTYRIAQGPDAAQDMSGTWSTADLADDVDPGSVAKFTVPLQPVGTPGQDLNVTWRIINPAYKGGYTERLTCVASDPGAVFLLTDMSRHFNTNDKFDVKLSFYNESADTWKKSDYKVGYRWAYLDGTPATATPSGLTSLTGDVASGQQTAITSKVTAPPYPGRYVIVWDLVQPDGKVVGDVETVARPGGLYPLQVWVAEGHGSKATTVDLSKSFNERGVSFEGEPSPGFDGASGIIPGEMLPPDGIREVDGNPFLIGKPGPNLYPSGYFAQSTGSGWNSNHRIPFLYPGKQDSNVVSCQGQTIDLPNGNYAAVHILAATKATSPANTTFTLLLGGKSQPMPTTVATWTNAPAATNATVGFRSPYRLVNGAVDASHPAIFGDYSLSAVGGKLDKITLPNDPHIKVLAITLER